MQERLRQTVMMTRAGSATKRKCVARRSNYTDRSAIMKENSRKGREKPTNWAALLALGIKNGLPVMLKTPQTLMSVVFCCRSIYWTWQRRWRIRWWIQPERASVQEQLRLPARSSLSFRPSLTHLLHYPHHISRSQKYEAQFNGHGQISFLRHRIAY